MYWDRDLGKIIVKAATTFPVIVITGARQTGKSTLLKNLFRSHGSFLSMDDANFRSLLADNPEEYLLSLPGPIIIDEIQYFPEILPVIKRIIDKKRKPGSFFLTGSQQFHLMKNVSETLAGRAAVFSLPTFNISERKKVPGLEQYLLRGSYPEPVTNPKVDLNLWYSSYIQTYIERDLRHFLNVSDLKGFELFLKLLAARTSQELNYSRLASETGFSVPTIKRWVGVLESSYILFLLPPFYENFGKRIIKSPKLYFYDTGLVLYLLNIKEEGILKYGSFGGAIFENAVISEILKKQLGKGIRPEMYFWRAQDGTEIDLILQENGNFNPYEIKLSSSIKPEFLKNLNYWMSIANSPKSTGFLITNSQEKPPLPKRMQAIYWKNI